MQLTIVLQHTGDTEIAKNDFRMLLITEEQVARFDILVKDIITMTIGQGCSGL